jgi:RHS repeat-associated protein
MTVSVVGTPVGARPFGFAARHGYQSDADTGLQRLGHRFYDPATGRFLSRDPIRDGYNWYNYCGNDPVNKVDPQGLAKVGIIKRIQDWFRDLFKPRGKKPKESFYDNYRRQREAEAREAQEIEAEKQRELDRQRALREDNMSDEERRRAKEQWDKNAEAERSRQENERKRKEWDGFDPMIAMIPPVIKTIVDNTINPIPDIQEGADVIYDTIGKPKADALRNWADRRYGWDPFAEH